MIDFENLQGHQLSNISQIASHNTYDNSDWISLLDYVNTVEWDVWPVGWVVSHVWNKNAGTLDGYLRDLKRWHTKNSGHDLVTVFIEIKDVAEWKVHDFELKIRGHFRNNILFRPTDAVSSTGELTLRSQIETNGWPLLKDLKNKFMFVLNSASDSVLETYRKERPLTHGDDWNRNRLLQPSCFLMSKEAKQDQEACMDYVIFNAPYNDFDTKYRGNVLRRAYYPNMKLDSHENVGHARQAMRRKAINYLCFDSVELAFATGTHDAP